MVVLINFFHKAAGRTDRLLNLLVVGVDRNLQAFHSIYIPVRMQYIDAPVTVVTGNMIVPV